MLRVSLEVCVGAVPKNAKKAWNAQKTAGKGLREEGLGRHGSGGSVESEAGHFNEVIQRRITCRDNCKYAHIRVIDY